MCHNPKCNCQKQITCNTKQFQLEGNGLKNTMKKLFKGTEKAWNECLKPSLKIASPYIGMAVFARTKNPQIGRATGDISKSISVGKFLSLTDMHGHGLRLKVM